MTAFGIEITDREPVNGWEACLIAPLTLAEVALENARVDLAEAWKEVDYLDEQIQTGLPMQIARANAYIRANVAELVRDRAWEAVNAEKAIALAKTAEVDVEIS